MKKFRELFEAPRWKRSGSDGEIETTHKGKTWRVRKNYDHNDRHTGEYRIEIKKKNPYGGHDWDWHDTVRGKEHAKSRIQEGAMKRIATTQSNKADRMASTDKKGLETYKKKEEETTIGGVKMKKLGSRPGSYKSYVAKHLGDKAAEKIDKSDGNKLVAKGKKTGNQQMVRKGSFIKNVIAKEETQLDESLQIEKGAGIGTFLTAADMGMKTFGGFAYHPSVDPELEEEHGAGEEGTDKLTKKYKKDTPEQ